MSASSRQSKSNISGSNAGIEAESNANVAGSKVNLAGSKANIAGSKANIAGSSANVAESKANISQSKANISDSKANISASRANLAGSKANIAGSKANIAGSRANLSRASAGASRANIDASRAQVSASKASLAAAESMVAVDAADGAPKLEEVASRAESAKSQAQTELESASAPIIEEGSEHTADLPATTDDANSVPMVQAPGEDITSNDAPKATAEARAPFAQNYSTMALDEVVEEEIPGAAQEDGVEVDVDEEEIWEQNRCARVLETPPPDAEAKGVTFVNIDYEADPDAPTIVLATTLSRSASGADITPVLAGVPDPLAILPLDAYSAALAIPMMRAGSPTEGEKTAPEEAAVKGNAGKEKNVSTKSDREAHKTEDEPDGKRETTVGLLSEYVDRYALVKEIKALLEKKDKLKNRNLMLQNKLGDYFKRKRTEDNRDTEKSVTDQEMRYANCLNTLSDLRKEYDDLNANNQRVVDDIRARLAEKRDEADEKMAEFSKYKKNIAVAAENSRTGKPIPPKVVDQLEATDLRKEQEVNSVRLENIKLRNKLRRHEQLLRQKEELADGLHLIDFEQLKIENQTYNEKIEERNEELLKLRKKITNIVQVLTHVKEKLQFVQAENVDLRGSLGKLDIEVAEQRDLLPAEKQVRDSLRNTTLTMRQKNGLLGNRPLLRDFENKVDECEDLQARIDQLRAFHADIQAEVLSVKRKIKKAEITSGIGL